MLNKMIPVQITFKYCIIYLNYRVVVSYYLYSIWEANSTECREACLPHYPLSLQSISCPVCPRHAPGLDISIMHPFNTFFCTMLNYQCWYLSHCPSPATSDKGWLLHLRALQHMECRYSKTGASWKRMGGFRLIQRRSGMSNLICGSLEKTRVTLSPIHHLEMHICRESALLIQPWFKPILS